MGCTTMPEIDGETLYCGIEEYWETRFSSVAVYIAPAATAFMFILVSICGIGKDFCDGESAHAFYHCKCKSQDRPSIAVDEPDIPDCLTFPGKDALLFWVPDCNENTDTREMSCCERLHRRGFFVCLLIVTLYLF